MNNKRELAISGMLCCSAMLMGYMLLCSCGGGHKPTPEEEALTQEAWRNVGISVSGDSITAIDPYAEGPADYSMPRSQHSPSTHYYDPDFDADDDAYERGYRHGMEDGDHNRRWDSYDNDDDDPSYRRGYENGHEDAHNDSFWSDSEEEW